MWALGDLITAEDQNHGQGGFPGGTVVKNPPANAGDTGLSPGPGRSHMPRSNWACTPQLLSPCATTTEAHVPGAHAPQQEKPPQWDTHTPQGSVAPAHHNKRKAHKRQQRPNAAKKKKKKRIHGQETVNKSSPRIWA